MFHESQEVTAVLNSADKGGEHYLEGYQQCQQEVMRFLGSTAATQPHLALQLWRHLSFTKPSNSCADLSRQQSSRRICDTVSSKQCHNDVYNRYRQTKMCRPQSDEQLLSTVTDNLEEVISKTQKNLDAQKLKAKDQTHCNLSELKFDAFYNSKCFPTHLKLPSTVSTLQNNLRPQSCYVSDETKPSHVKPSNVLAVVSKGGAAAPQQEQDVTQITSNKPLHSCWSPPVSHLFKSLSQTQQQLDVRHSTEISHRLLPPALPPPPSQALSSRLNIKTHTARATSITRTYDLCSQSQMLSSADINITSVASDGSRLNSCRGNNISFKEPQQVEQQHQHKQLQQQQQHKQQPHDKHKQQQQQHKQQPHDKYKQQQKQQQMLYSRKHWKKSLHGQAVIGPISQLWRPW